LNIYEIIFHVQKLNFIIMPFMSCLFWIQDPRMKVGLFKLEYDHVCLSCHQFPIYLIFCKWYLKRYACTVEGLVLLSS
jgi:hypothetical protein